MPKNRKGLLWQIVNCKRAENILMVLFGIVAFGSFFSYLPVPMKNLDLIPNAITGLTTLSGILSAFVGFWLSRQDSFGDKETRKWSQERSVTIILFLVFGLLFVAGSLTSLVYQPVQFAFLLAVLGTLIIIWAVFDVLLFHVLSSMRFEEK